MSGTHGGFDPLARRDFRLWREIAVSGTDGYRLAVASLAEEAARLAAADGRVVVSMTFTIERVTGNVLHLVAVGTARVASSGTIDARAIGGDAP